MSRPLQVDAAGHPQVPPPRSAFRVNETAAQLGVSRAHIYNLIARGMVRVVKLGDVTLIPASEVDRLLEGGDAK